MSNPAEKDFKTSLNNFLDSAFSLLRPTYVFKKEEFIKLRKKDLTANFKINIDKRKLKGSKKISEIVPIYSISLDHKVDCLVPRWWHKFIFWKKFKYQDFHMKREFLSIKDLL